MSKTFKELAEKAAKMERDGESREAASCWLRAEVYSDSKINREWCRARAAFCENNLWRGVVA